MRPRGLRPGPPPLVSTDLSMAGPDPTAQRREPGWEKRRREQHLAQSEAMGVLTQLEAHLGGVLDLMRAAPAGDVLAQLSQVIPAAGFFTLGWPAGFQALSIANFGASALTVASGGPSVAGAPSIGAGVFVVSPKFMRTVPSHGKAATIYGAAGVAFDLVAYSLSS